MRLLGQGLAATLGCEALLALSVSAAPLEKRIDNYACPGSAHPTPVIMLHGLGANKNEDINYLEAFLQAQGYCTFSLTYGSFFGFDLVGGLQHISTSAQQIGAFINQTLALTGASKVSLVGHSEGAFQALYVPKFEGVAEHVDKIVAIAPPAHGTTFAGLYNLAYVLGNTTRGLVGEVLNLLGCPACNDLGIGGAAVARLNDGKPILQPGNTMTIIASRSDELVTPTDTAFVHEVGVRNLYIQDYCPNDPVGHIGEAYDTNTWNLVLNALDEEYDRSFTCVLGAPGR